MFGLVKFPKDSEKEERRDYRKIGTRKETLNGEMLEKKEEFEDRTVLKRFRLWRRLWPFPPRPFQ